LKVPSVSDAVTLDGKVFQTHGAATKNARSPIVLGVVVKVGFEPRVSRVKE